MAQNTGTNANATPTVAAIPPAAPTNVGGTAPPDPAAQIAALTAQVAALATIVQAQVTAATATATATLPSSSDTAYGGLLNLKSKFENSLYESACGKLPTTFDGSIESLTAFIIDLRSRAADTVSMSAFDVDVNGTALSLLDCYARVTDQEIERSRAARFGIATAPLAPDIVALNRQRAKMMYKCILSSVSPSVKERIGSQTFDHDGATLLHFVVSKLFLGTQTKKMSFKRDLMTLDPSDFGFDIEKINKRIKSTCTILEAAGEAVSDCDRTTYLLSAYAKINKPAEWVTKITFTKNQLDSGIHLSSDRIMAIAEGQYSNLQSEKKWEKANPPKEILGMQGKGGNGGRDGGKKNSKWTFIDRQPGEPDHKVVNGQTFWYCNGKHRAFWCLHKPENCKGKAQQSTSPNPTAPAPKEDASTLKAAFAGILDNHFGGASEEAIAALIAAAGVSL